MKLYGEALQHQRLELVEVVHTRGEDRQEVGQLECREHHSLLEDHCKHRVLQLHFSPDHICVEAECNERESVHECQAGTCQQQLGLSHLPIARVEWWNDLGQGQVSLYMLSSF